MALHPDRMESNLGPDGPPNVLWIQADELRADALGAYGGIPGWQAPCTPNLDELAATGTLFTNTYCQSPVCVPSRTSLLSGRYPLQTGILDNGALKKGRAANYTGLWLPQVFQGAGYYTTSFGKDHVVGPSTWDRHEESDADPEAGYLRFFPPQLKATSDSIRLPGAPRVLLAGTYPAGEETPTTELTDTVIGWLSASQGLKRPWFAQVSYLAPHTPVLAPAEFIGKASLGDFTVGGSRDSAPLSQYEQTVAALQKGEALSDEEVLWARASYWACVAHLDHEVGRLVEAARAASPEVVVVFNADHGALHGEYGLWQKHTFMRPSHRVPSIFSAPGRLATGTRDDLSELVDMGRTLFALCGIAAPDTFVGRDLAAGPVPESIVGVIGAGDPGSILFPLSGLEEPEPPAPQRVSVRTHRYRYERTTRIEGHDIGLGDRRTDPWLVDYRDDPGEARNLAGGARFRLVESAMEARLSAALREGR